jgi:hypothetical protein
LTPLAPVAFYLSLRRKTKISRRRNRAEEHAVLRRINWRHNWTGPAVRIVGPVRAKSNIQAVGLRLKLEAARPRKPQAGASIRPVERNSARDEFDLSG